jgi:hypothetical protein
MSLSIKIDNKEFPEGHVFSISSLGTFVNGEVREVDEEQEQAFVNERGIHVKDALANDPNVEVTGSATATVPEVPVEEEEEVVEDDTTTENEGGES